MARSKEFLKGISFGFLNQGVVILAGLWLTPFLLKRLGQEEYGIWLVGLQVLAYLTLLDLGVVSLLPREVAKAAGGSAERQDRSVAVVVGSVTRLVLFQTLIAIAVVLGFWALLPAEWQAYRGAIQLVTGFFACSFPCRIFRATLQGLQDLAFVGQLQIAAWACGTVVTVACVMFGLRIYSPIFGWITTETINIVGSLARLLAKHRHALPRGLPPLAPGVAKEYMGKSGWVSLSQLTQALMNGSDVLVLGKMLGPPAVVAYSCTTKLGSVLSNQPQMIMQTALPGLSNMSASDPASRMQEVCNALGQAMLLLSGLIFCVVVAVNGPFVSWWVGPHTYGGLALTALSLGAMLVRHSNTVLIYALFSLGKERRMLFVTLFDGLFTLAATIVLAPWAGVASPAIAAILASVLISLPLNGAGLASALHVSGIDLARPLLPWFGRFTIVAALSLLFAAAGPKSIWWMPLAALAFGGLYLAVNWKVLMMPPIGTYVQPLYRAAVSHARGLVSYS